MDASMIDRLESSFAIVAPQGETLVTMFYERLFETQPAVRDMFPADMSEQRAKLLGAIGLVMQNIRNPDVLVEPLHELGGRHAEYGTEPEHYPIVRDTLVAVMRELAGGDWSEQLSEDWTAALDFIASVMIEGTNEVRKAA